MGTGCWSGGDDASNHDVTAPQVDEHGPEHGDCNDPDLDPDSASLSPCTEEGESCENEEGYFCDASSSQSATLACCD
ncbi:hypothetical protein Purlil1_14031 [Purpureocillium lilacinum]|uniref:Uncharacterized protein n=1 Tax=Purpureocillium lilacinum TaxID=33203 RepID=A0ABR0BCF7_PURLI|nr:hypothetical protein Purlil1_14031 [Purpureocillium lilacinum]